MRLLVNGFAGRKRQWIATGLCCITINICADNWPQWRGPAANGIPTGKALPVEWDTNRNIAWKVALPGTGWSQPIVWDDKIYLTLAETDNQSKPKGGEFDPGVPRGRRGLGDPGGATNRPPGAGAPGSDSPAGNRPAPGQFPLPPAPDVVYRWKVMCLDDATGRVLWLETAREGKPAIPVHRNNTYASETPVTDGDRLYAYFGAAGLHSFDLSGKIKWSKDLGTYPIMNGWGTSSSPILHGNHVFIQCDNDKESFVVALDKQTGKEVWRVLRDERSNWSTPYIWKNKQRTELVLGGGTKICSYKPETGELLWEVAGSGRTSITPVGDEDMLYVDSYARIMGGRGALVAIRAGGSGDITPQSGETPNGFVAWTVPLNSYRISSPLIYGGCVYQLDQQSSMVRCFDAKTGVLNYHERLPDTRGFTASPWGHDGQVFCLDETGTTVVLRAGPKFEIVRTNKLEGETFWSSVAVLGNRLLLRGVDHLYCISR